MFKIKLQPSIFLKIENVNRIKVLCRTVYQYRNLPTTDFDQICQHHNCLTFECHPNMAT